MTHSAEEDIWKKISNNIMQVGCFIATVRCLSRWALQKVSTRPRALVLLIQTLFRWWRCSCARWPMPGAVRSNILDGSLWCVLHYKAVLGLCFAVFLLAEPSYRLWGLCFLSPVPFSMRGLSATLPWRAVVCSGRAVLLFFLQKKKTVCFCRAVFAECAGNRDSSLFPAHDLRHYAGPLAGICNIHASLVWPGRCFWLPIYVPHFFLAGCWGFSTEQPPAADRPLYGYFSMNLNALWNPVGVQGTVYSRLLPAQNQVNGNYDAFAYLGLGVLLALPIVLIRGRKTIRQHFRAHWALGVVCLLLTVFAVSNVVTANGVTVCTIPLPGKIIQLCSVFRSGGRLFWPVYDLLVLCAFVGIARLPRAVPAAFLLAMIQIWDASPGLYQRHQDMNQATQDPGIPFPTAERFLGNNSGALRTYGICGRAAG